MTGCSGASPRSSSESGDRAAARVSLSHPARGPSPHRPRADRAAAPGLSGERGRHEGQLRRLPSNTKAVLDAFAPGGLRRRSRAARPSSWPACATAGPGCISATANVHPGPIARLCRDVARGRRRRAAGPARRDPRHHAGLRDDPRPQGHHRPLRAAIAAWQTRCARRFRRCPDRTRSAALVSRLEAAGVRHAGAQPMTVPSGAAGVGGTRSPAPRARCHRASSRRRSRAKGCSPVRAIPAGHADHRVRGGGDLGRRRPIRRYDDRHHGAPPHVPLQPRRRPVHRRRRERQRGALHQPLVRVRTAQAVEIDGRIWIESICPIEPGDELTYDYAYARSEMRRGPRGPLRVPLPVRRPAAGTILAAEEGDGRRGGALLGERGLTPFARSGRASEPRSNAGSPRRRSP